MGVSACVGDLGSCVKVFAINWGIEMDDKIENIRTLEGAMMYLDENYERWELRRYTHTFDEGRVKDPLYTLAMMPNDKELVEAVHYPEFGYSSDILTTVKRGLIEYEENFR